MGDGEKGPIAWGRNHPHDTEYDGDAPWRPREERKNASKRSLEHGIRWVRHAITSAMQARRVESDVRTPIDPRSRGVRRDPARGPWFERATVPPRHPIGSVSTGHVLQRNPTERDPRRRMEQVCLFTREPTWNGSHLDASFRRSLLSSRSSTPRSLRSNRPTVPKGMDSTSTEEESPSTSTVGRGNICQNQCGDEDSLP